MNKLDQYKHVAFFSFFPQNRFLTFKNVYHRLLCADTKILCFPLQLKKRRENLLLF